MRGASVSSTFRADFLNYLYVPTQSKNKYKQIYYENNSFRAREEDRAIRRSEVRGRRVHTEGKIVEMLPRGSGLSNVVQAGRHQSP